MVRMREKLKNLIMLLAVSLLLSSCGIFSIGAASGKQLGDKCDLKLEVFQTLSRNEALCMEKSLYSSNDVYKIITESNLLYDGQVISGRWVLVDTYTYETKDNRIKTVPVLMPLSEYKERKQWQ